MNIFKSLNKVLPRRFRNNKGFMAIASLGATVGGALGMAGPLTYGTSLAIGAATVGVGGYLGSTLLSKMSPSMPDSPASLTQSVGPAPTFQDAQTTSREDTLDLLRRKRTGTTLTSPEGLLSTGDITTKTLLGS